MHAFLLTSSGILPAFAPGDPDTLQIFPGTSVSIEDISSVRHFLSRKPMGSGGNTVIIHSAEKMTLPAQHALLKTLEEPPAGSSIYLVTSHPDSLLPTILSRVQIINASETSAPDLSRITATRKILDQILPAGAGERLLIMEKLVFTRDSAHEFLNDLEHLLHNQIISKTYNLRPNTYNLIVETRKYLTANVNVKLALSHLFLDL